MRRTPFAHICLLIVFLFNSVITVPIVQAQELVLPKPGVMVRLSPPVNAPTLKGMKVNPNNPFRFEFILDKGDIVETRHASSLQDDSSRLIKYFLASLTIPEKDLWVNLSPYEKDRIVPDSFGLTEMGRDLLAQDYILKQVTASLIYPEDEVGKKFWKRVYEDAAKKYGNTNIPVNTFNKVWIVPEKAVVYENAKAGTAYVVESKLKVMLEQDYLSLEKNTVGAGLAPALDKRAPARGARTDDVNQIGSQIVREIVIPELTKEINEGANFAQLRQVYSSLILATWYKKKIKDSILSKVYADRNKIDGVKNQGLDVQSVYQQYLAAFKKGVYNYIKEDIDPVTQERIPRKYFSGGWTCTHLDMAMSITANLPEAAVLNKDRAMVVEAGIRISKDQAMNVLPADEFKPQRLAARFNNNYAIDIPAQVRTGYLTVLMQNGNYWDQVNQEGYQYFRTKDGQKLVEVDRLGTRRYFDLNGRWLLELDYFGHPTVQCRWSVDAAHLISVDYLSLSGEIITLRDTNPSLNEKSVKSVTVYKGKEELYKYYVPSGMDFITNGEIPFGVKMKVDDLFPAGYGLMLINIMAKIAKDKKDAQLYFKGNRKRIKADFFFILRDVLMNDEGNLNEYADFPKVLERGMKPKPLDLIRYPNRQVLSADRPLDEQREQEILLAVDPETQRPYRVFFQGKQYILRERIRPVGSMTRYVQEVNEDRIKGWGIFDNDRRIAVIDIKGKRLDQAMITGSSTIDEASHLEQVKQFRQMLKRDFALSDTEIDVIEESVGFEAFAMMIVARSFMNHQRLRIEEMLNLTQALQGIETTLVRKHDLDFEASFSSLGEYLQKMAVRVGRKLNSNKALRDQERTGLVYFCARFYRLHQENGLLVNPDDKSRIARELRAGSKVVVFGPGLKGPLMMQGEFSGKLYLVDVNPFVIDLLKEFRRQNNTSTSVEIILADAADRSLPFIQQLQSEGGAKWINVVQVLHELGRTRFSDENDTELTGHQESSIEMTSDSANSARQQFYTNLISMLAPGGGVAIYDAPDEERYVDVLKSELSVLSSKGVTVEISDAKAKDDSPGIFVEIKRPDSAMSSSALRMDDPKLLLSTRFTYPNGEKVIQMPQEGVEMALEDIRLTQGLTFLLPVSGSDFENAVYIKGNPDGSLSVSPKRYYQNHDKEQALSRIVRAPALNESAVITLGRELFEGDEAVSREHLEIRLENRQGTMVAVIRNISKTNSTYLPVMLVEDVSRVLHRISETHALLSGQQDELTWNGYQGVVLKLSDRTSIMIKQNNDGLRGEIPYYAVRVDEKGRGVSNSVFFNERLEIGHNAQGRITLNGETLTEDWTDPLVDERQASVEIRGYEMSIIDENSTRGLVYTFEGALSRTQAQRASVAYRSVPLQYSQEPATRKVVEQINFANSPDAVLESVGFMYDPTAQVKGITLVKTRDEQVTDFQFERESFRLEFKNGVPYLWFKEGGKEFLESGYALTEIVPHQPAVKKYVTVTRYQQGPRVFESADHNSMIDAVALLEQQGVKASEIAIRNRDLHHDDYYHPNYDATVSEGNWARYLKKSQKIAWIDWEYPSWYELPADENPIGYGDGVIDLVTNDITRDAPAGMQVILSVDFDYFVSNNSPQERIVATAQITREIEAMIAKDAQNLSLQQGKVALFFNRSDGSGKINRDYSDPGEGQWIWNQLINGYAKIYGPAVLAVKPYEDRFTYGEEYHPDKAMTAQDILEAYYKGNLYQQPQIAAYLSELEVDPVHLDAAIEEVAREVIREELSNTKHPLNKLAQGSESVVYKGIVGGNDIIVKDVRSEEAWLKYKEYQDRLGVDSSGKPIVAGYLVVDDLKIIVDGEVLNIPHAVVQEEGVQLLDRVREIRKEYANNPAAQHELIENILNDYFEMYKKLLARGLIMKPNGFLVDVGIKKGENHVVVFDVGDLLTPEEAQENGYDLAEFDWKFTKILMMVTLYRNFRSEPNEHGLKVEVIEAEEELRTSVGGLEYSIFDRAKDEFANGQAQQILSSSAKKYREFYVGSYKIREKIKQQRLSLIEAVINKALSIDQLPLFKDLPRIGEDRAQTAKGGIDFNADKMNLQIQHAGEGIKFNTTPEMLQQLQDAKGFVPVIMKIYPMTDLKAFLGITQASATTLPVT